MGQFWGLSIGDDSLVPCAVNRYLPRISRCTVDTGSFGLGWYSRGELLQRVEPGCREEPLDVLRMVENVRADLLVMHARKTKGGPTKREDIHPFRFKEWLFAHNGTIDGFDVIKNNLLEAIPSFLRRNIKGETDSELIFHLFLSFLYDAGALNRPEPQISQIGDAVVRTIATVDEFAHVRHIPPSPASIIVSDGYSLVAASRGIPVEYTLMDTISDCARCRTSMRPGDPESAKVNHDVRAVLVCSCESPSTETEFALLNDNSLLLISKHQEITIRAFG